jgi:26S proteasome regulatory subunit N5
MHRLAEDRGLENLPAFKGLLKKFMTLELMNWEELTHAAAKELESLEVFKSTRREEVMTDWKQRVIEHNLRTIAKYYSKIELPRLAQLLELSEEAAEKNLSELVVSKSVFARIDRIKGEINFVKKQDAPDVLNDWAHDIASLLKSVEKTCHLIQRENMVHGIDAS